MQSFILPTILLASGLATALPSIPKPLEPRQGAPMGMDARCAQGMILAQGIALNIADQQQELATANSMAATIQAQPVDSAAWAQSRTNLLQFINNGIAIREMNQLITPPQSRATAGVAIVANAQLMELNLATNLTTEGSDNPQGNLQIVQTLQMDFMGGIMQNQKNMADAMAGCGAAGAAPAAAEPAPQTASNSTGGANGGQAAEALASRATIGAHNAFS